MSAIPIKANPMSIIAFNDTETQELIQKEGLKTEISNSIPLHAFALAKLSKEFNKGQSIIGHFTLSKKKPRKYFWQKSLESDLVEFIIFQNGDMSSFVKDSRYSQLAEIVTAQYECATFRNTTVYVLNN